MTMNDGRLVIKFPILSLRTSLAITFPPFLFLFSLIFDPCVPLPVFHSMFRLQMSCECIERVPIGWISAREGRCHHWNEGLISVWTETRSGLVKKHPRSTSLAHSEWGDVFASFIFPSPLLGPLSFRSGTKQVRSYRSIYDFFAMDWK